MVDDATVIVKENDTRKRKLIESVLIQSTNNFNINQTNLNTDKFTNIILNNFSSRIKKTLGELKENGTHVTTGVMIYYVFKWSSAGGYVYLFACLFVSECVCLWVCLFVGVLVCLFGAFDHEGVELCSQFLVSKLMGTPEGAQRPGS